MAKPLTIAIVALVAFFAIYVLAIQTEIGQRADEAALAGGRSAPERAQSGANGLLRLVSIGSLVAAILALGALAWLWRRPWLILLPAAVVGVSLLATEAFKLVIFQRPDLWPSPDIVGNSYPSGHTTVGISLGLSALLIAPTRLRPLIAVLAALFAAGLGILVVTADWHRPSDPLGSYALTLAVAAGSVAALRAWNPRRLVADTAEHVAPPSTVLARRVEAAAIAGGVLLFGGAVVLAALRYGSEVVWNRPHAAFLVSVAAILVAAGITVGALLRALPEPGESAPGTAAP
jgi:membrane-associated phospholipid phosphatase